MSGKDGMKQNSHNQSRGLIRVLPAYFFEVPPSKDIRLILNVICSLNSPSLQWILKVRKLWLATVRVIGNGDFHHRIQIMVYRPG
jgi:hypothetical protein